MMEGNFAWLAQEARNIHQYFNSLFYLLVTVFLVLGILIDYFKFPLGETPGFPVLVGRAFIAAILLLTFPEFIRILSDLTDDLYTKLNSVNQFVLVRAKLADKVGEFSFHWVSVKETLTVGIAYISFILFHFSIYVADAFLLYTWVFLYLVSPLLIALYVLPATSSATRALYRSLIEVSCWKPVWAITATILWSTALGDLNKPTSEISFLSVICYCLILAGSLLLTPFVVHALAGQGLSQLAKNFGTISLGATVLGPMHVTRQLGRFGERSGINRFPGSFGKWAFNSALSGGHRLTQGHLPRVNQFINRVPRFNSEKNDPVFMRAGPGAKNDARNSTKKRGRK